MFGKLFPRQRKGQVIRAETLNRSITEIERQTRISAASPLRIVDTPNGPQLSDSSEVPFVAKLTSGSGSGPYAWTRQVSTAAGTWADGAQTGTTSIDPAYNAGGSPTLTLPLRVWVRRNDGTLYFTAGSC